VPPPAASKGLGAPQSAGHGQYSTAPVWLSCAMLVGAGAEISKALDVSTRTARRVYEQGSVAKPLAREATSSDGIRRVAGA
jgi:hypothetical protein